MQENIRATRILGEVLVERDKQDAKWGEQNWPSTNDACRDAIPDEATAKEACDTAVREGRCTWAHITIEELAEALAAPDDKSRREELVQLAAVVAAWIECIDRRAGS